MSKGFFITVEGIDGSGKTTQAIRMQSFLTQMGKKVMLTKEPGGTNVGLNIRKILLNESMDPITEFLLFASDRREHIKETIIPCLEKGCIVISDRFLDSSTAYQGFGRGVPFDFINYIHSRIMDTVVPDITFIFDVDPSVGLSRLNEKDRIERAGTDFLAKVRNGYLSLAKTSNRFVVVDANKSEEEVWKRVKEILTNKIGG